MEHVSKFDSCIYGISYSVTDQDGVQKEDDITLIWRDSPCGFEEAVKNNFSLRELVGWYWGDYDYKVTERYIKEYYQKKLSEEK